MAGKLGIICAMDSELEPILKDIKTDRILEKAGMKFYEGNLNGTDVVAVKCGIAKVNAAVCTQIIIDNFDVTHILNSGVAGGTKADIYPLDVVIGTDLVQHDLDATAFNYKKGQVPQMDTFSFPCDEKMVSLAVDCGKIFSDIKFHKGRIVSGDQFISDKMKSIALSNEFNSSATEMEGASIAHVCYLNSVPCIVIRSISDNAINGEAVENYEEFCEKASKNSYKFIKEFVSLFGKSI